MWGRGQPDPRAGSRDAGAGGIPFLMIFDDLFDDFVWGVPPIDFLWGGTPHRFSMGSNPMGLYSNSCQNHVFLSNTGTCSPGAVWTVCAVKMHVSGVSSWSVILECLPGVSSLRYPHRIRPRGKSMVPLP